MPEGVLVTVPVPVPLRETVSGNCVTGVVVNAASTLAAAFKVTLQLPVPEHAPVQPVKVEPAVGVAVRGTHVSSLKIAPPLVPPFTPKRVLATVPAPVPLRVAGKANCGEVVNAAP